MQNNFLTTIRSLKLIDGCKGTQVYALNPSSSGNGGGDKGHLRPSFSIQSKSVKHHHHSSSLVFENLLPCGLPSADQIDPTIDPFLRPVDLVSALAASFRRLSDSPDPAALCDLHLEQHSLFRPLADLKLLRRSLRFARLHAPDVHHRFVLSAWLRLERREDELDPSPPPLASCSGTSPALECPRAALSSDPFSPSYPCPCRGPSPDTSVAVKPSTADEEEGDVWFCIGDEEVACVRCRVATLSTLLYGGFAEARRERINFTHNGISARGMKAVERLWCGEEVVELGRDEELLGWRRSRAGAPPPLPRSRRAGRLLGYPEFHRSWHPALFRLLLRCRLRPAHQEPRRQRVFL